MSRQAAVLTSALQRAADAIDAALVADQRICEAGPPSERTRSQRVTTLLKLQDAADKRACERSRARASAFAHSLRSLPALDAQAARLIGHHVLTAPAVVWTPHRSASARLEHSGLLPRLFSCLAKHKDVPFKRCL